MSSWLSDALCRLASGGSFAVRQLYTDDEEVLFKATRPTLLNGIEDVIGRSDLADRAIFLTLRPIAEEQRRSETELWREFEGAQPRILGALLHAASHGLGALDSVQLAQLSRMADFALWAMACEKGLWPAGTFARAYPANRNAEIEGMIDIDPIAVGVRELMSERSFWKGSAADLLQISVERSSQGDNTHWPKNPRALAGRLRRAQTFLRALGIDITFGREGRAGTRVIRCAGLLQTPSAPSAARTDPVQHKLRWVRPLAFTTTAHALGPAPRCRRPIRARTKLTMLTMLTRSLLRQAHSMVVRVDASSAVRKARPASRNSGHFPTVQRCNAGGSLRRKRRAPSPIRRHAPAAPE